MAFCGRRDIIRVARTGLPPGEIFDHGSIIDQDQREETMKKDRDVIKKRRQFLKTFGGTALFLPFVGIAACSGDKEAAAPASKPAAAPRPEPMPEPEAPTAAPAGGAPARLSEDDPQAKSLSYVHDATTLEGSQTRYKSGQACVNCALYKAEEGAEWGGCSIFPGKEVKATGWCSVYAPKPG